MPVPRFLLVLVLACAAALAPAQPNVVLIISDDLNNDVAPYVDWAHTPNLRRLADQGVTFNNAYCQFPLCGPSRASFMSGLYPETTRVLTNSYELGGHTPFNPNLADHPSIGAFLRANGFWTARVLKVFHMGVPRAVERGHRGSPNDESWDFHADILPPERFSEPADGVYSHSKGVVVPNGEEYTQGDYLATSQAIAILEQRSRRRDLEFSNHPMEAPDQPFFLAVGLLRPHVPYVAPERCYDLFDFNEIELPEVVRGDNVPDQAFRHRGVSPDWTDTQKREYIWGYRASVAFVDEQVGRILDAIERFELADETVVIFVSDHGYNLGEHGAWSKVHLWEESARVPLIISVPGRPELGGRSTDAMVELIDLYPTIAELAGLSDAAPENLQGDSLAGYLTGRDAEPVDDLPVAYTVTGRGAHASIRTTEWRYTRWGGDEVGEELYHHATDPDEHVNLADDAGHADTLEEMRALLAGVRTGAQEAASNDR